MGVVMENFESPWRLLHSIRTYISYTFENKTRLQTEPGEAQKNRAIQDKPTKRTAFIWLKKPFLFGFGNTFLTWKKRSRWGEELQQKTLSAAFLPENVLECFF